MNKKKVGSGLWCMFVAIAILAICSRSSFLYPMNDWDDAQSFFTVGKSMMRGKVPYRDLFEHKGPYLYFIYGLASLLFETSFYGVYIMECISLTVFLYFSMRTMMLFCKEKSAMLMIPLLAYATCSVNSFYWGGAAEEFCLPFLAISLYDALRYMKDRELPSARILIVNGVCAGIIGLIKYTMLGFHFAWMLMFIILLIYKKEWKKIFTSSMLFLTGMITAMIPWFIYFGLQGALDEWFYCYIYTNLFMYGGRMISSGIYEKVYGWMKILYWIIFDNIAFFVPVLLGMIGLVCLKRFDMWAKLQVCILFGMMFLVIYIGDNNLFYYALPFCTFAAIGYGLVGTVVDKFAYKKKKVYILSLFAVFLFSVTMSFCTSANVFFMNCNKEDLYVYRLKEIIVKEENPTLLNYNCIDAGVYTATGIIPTCRFFHRPNVSNQEMFDMQDLFVQEGKVMFVLAKNTYPSDIEENYQLVAQEKHLHFGEENIYYLFKIKE